jgi:hypothetical protein
MRLEITDSDSGVILTSPDVPGFRRTARGADQVWHRLVELQQALRGVQQGTYAASPAEQLDTLVGDADASMVARVRNQAKRVRAATDKLREIQAEERDRERLMLEEQRQREEVEREIADAEAAYRAAKAKAAKLGVRKAKKAPTSTGRGVFAPKTGLGRKVDPDIEARRERVAAKLDSGVTRAVDIASQLDLTPGTVHNDLVTIRTRRARNA